MTTPLIIGLCVLLALAFTILVFLLARIITARRAANHAADTSRERLVFPPLPTQAPALVRLQRLAQNPGLSLNELGDVAPVRAFEKKDGGEEENTCAVCLEVMEQDGKTRRMPCGHEFDAKCIEEWVTKANRCPVCNTHIIEEDHLHKTRLAAIEGTVPQPAPNPNAPRQRRRRARGENGTFELRDPTLALQPPQDVAIQVQ